MASLLSRYAAGEHDLVWREIRALGPVPADRIEDVEAVATATMQRVAVHVERLAAAYDLLGFVPWQYDEPLVEASDPVDVAALIEEVGPLPAALWACLSMVGAVSFMGDCPELGLRYHADPKPDPGMPPGPNWPDPLVLPSAGTLLADWREVQAEDPDAGSEVIFAPDELHKAAYSGGTHDIDLRAATADPVLLNVAGRPGVTLVTYLRISIAWGGLPGYQFAPAAAPPAVAELRRDPDF